MITDRTRVRTVIDEFIQAKLEANVLAIGPEADRRTLLRRLKFDLHGLPATPEELDEFTNDKGPDAYERLVDRLLDSPRYGERWARHWLDVVRFAESKGYERDRIRENAENTYQAHRAQASYIAGLQNTQEETVQMLDTNLNQYRQQVAEVKAQEEVLDKLRKDAAFKALANGSDDSRVNLIVDAVQPDAKDFVWPNMYMFLSLGTLGDAGAQALLDAPALRRLGKLDIHHHYVSPQLVNLLKKAVKEVDASDKQEAGDDGDRYVAVAE